MMRRWIIIVGGTFAVAVPIFWLIVEIQIRNVKSAHKRDLESTSDQADPKQSHQKPENRQRFYSREEWETARTTAMLNKYPSIDDNWLRKLIQTTSGKKNIPETELWIITAVLLKEVYLVPDKKKAEALRQLLAEVVSGNSTVRRKSIIRMKHVFSEKDTAAGTKVHFVFFNHTGRNLKFLRGKIHLFDKKSVVIARLPLVCDYPIRAVGSNDGHGYRIWRLNPATKAILAKPHRYYSCVQFYADEIVYSDGNREFFE